LLPVACVMLAYRYGLLFATTVVLGLLLVTGVTVNKKRHVWPPRAIHSKMVDLILKYFSVKIAFEEPWDTTQRHIVIGTPHGVFPASNIAWIWAYRRYLDTRPQAGLAAEACFRIPIYGHLFSALGGVSASRDSAMKCLKEDKSIGMISLLVLMYLLLCQFIFIYSSQ